MREVCNTFADMAWWVCTGIERKPLSILSLQPSRSATAAVFWAWVSATIVTGALIYTGSLDRRVPTWVLAVTGSAALLWAPTLYAAFADSASWKRLLIVVIALGAPVWILPVPAEAALSALERFAFWSTIAVSTTFAVPLLAFPLRIMRSRPSTDRLPTPL